MRWRWSANFQGPEGVKSFPLIPWMLLGCGVGLVFSVFGWFILKSSWDVKNNWLDVSAVITEVKMERYEDKDHNDYYRGIVDYEYQVESDKFTGVNRTAGSSYPSVAEKWLAEYKIGETMPIKVNPRYKYQSKSLEDANDWVGNYAMLFLGLVLFFSFGGGGAYGLKKRRTLRLMENKASAQSSDWADKNKQNNI